MTDYEGETNCGAIATGGDARLDAVGRDTKSAIALELDLLTGIDKPIFEGQRALHPRNRSGIVLALELELAFFSDEERMLLVLSNRGFSRTTERFLLGVHYGSRTITTTRGRAIGKPTRPP
jgi:hypothetical protein